MNLNQPAINETIEIRAQQGPQEDFLACPADIVFYGGAAGGGKTYGLLIDPLRHQDNRWFKATIFRRTTPELTNPGGMWDESEKIYPLLGATSSGREWTFPSKMQIKMGHLHEEKDKFSWQGAQLAYIGFDEVNQFTKSQFFYMLSRLRSMSGVRGRIRATCNPDPDSWVAEFLAWWIDQETGYPIAERSGKIRWFTRVNDEIVWSDTKDHPRAKSVTFIPSKLQDNKILMDKDPAYLSNLEALNYVDRMRLLHGNWKIRASAGTMFRREWFEIVDILPADTKACRYWDRASSEKETAAYTAGVKLHRATNGLFFVSNVVRFQGRPLRVEESIKNTTIQDGIKTTVGIEQDPGQAGVMEAEHYVRLLAGYDVRVARVSVDKVTRANPVSAQCERGNIKLLRGPWNQAFVDELEGFPDSKWKDQVDSFSGAFNLLTGDKIGTFTKQMAGSNVNTIASAMRGDKALW